MGKQENKTEKIIKDLEIKQDIVKLENFYVTGQLENLPLLVQQRKEDIVNEIMNYKEKHIEEKYDKDGNVISTKIVITPFIVSNYFFRSITNLQNIEPQYSGEQLSILWDLYNDIVMNVNMYLCEFTPTLSHFCKYIGVTTSGFKKMKNSSDEGIKVVVTKIIDNLYDENVKMAELDKHNARATVYRMKSELDKVERETPQVTINATNIDLDGINKRIMELSTFNNKVGIEDE